MKDFPYKKINPYNYNRGLFYLSLATSYSHGVKPQLPSALRSLTSVFGMGTGVTFSPLLPSSFVEGLFLQN